MSQNALQILARQDARTHRTSLRLVPFFKNLKKVTNPSFHPTIVTANLSGTWPAADQTNGRVPNGKI